MAKTNEEIRLQRRFGDRLRSIRISQGIEDAKQMADLLGKKEQAYRKYERGESIPGDLETLKRLCELLDVPADFLLLGIGAPRRESGAGKRTTRTP